MADEPEVFLFADKPALRELWAIKAIIVAGAARSP
jgi:hypothetical protein